MSKIRLNQNSQFEIQCLVNDVPTWRLAIRETLPDGDTRFTPDFDEGAEIRQETHEGEFIIITK
jgi:hypothetical protein